MNRPRVISLCSGAGISELGVLQFLATVLAVESWWRACCSFIANHPGVRVVHGDICDLALIRWARQVIGWVDGIIATPPCPSFSKAGNQDPDDPRSKVLLAVLDWVAVFMPRFVIIENVQDLVKFPHFWIVLQRLRFLGYEVQAWHLDAMDFGAAQRRPRIFIVAVKSGETLPEEPLASYGSSLRPYRNIQDAIGSMTPEERFAYDCDRLSPKRSAIMEPVPDGGNWRSLDGWRLRFVWRSVNKVGHRRPQERTCRRYHALDLADTIMTGVQIKKVTLPLPPRSIVGENRPFSVAEVLRLMDVEQSFYLVGTRADRYRQVGNGVPVRLMAAVCRAVYVALYGSHSAESEVRCA